MGMNETIQEKLGLIPLQIQKLAEEAAEREYPYPKHMESYGDRLKENLDNKRSVYRDGFLKAFTIVLYR